MFEQATRLKLRFDSPRGLLSVEDLWDLPLTSATGKPNLDDIAKALHRKLRESTETASFVTPAVADRNTEPQLAFDIVKHVIQVRIAERDAAQAATAKREFKQRLMEIIATKQDETLRGKPLEELQAMAAAM